MCRIYTSYRVAHPPFFRRPRGGWGGQKRLKSKQIPRQPRATLIAKASTKAAEGIIVIVLLSMTNGHKNIMKQNVVIAHTNSELSEHFRKTERNKINIWLRWLFARLFGPWICPTKCDLYALFACYRLCPLVHIPSGSPQTLL